MDKSGKNYSGSLQTSTHSSNFEYSSSSGIVSSMALLLLAARGEHRLEPPQRFVQIDAHALLHHERAHAAHGVADILRHVVVREHLRLCAEFCLVFFVVDLRVARRHDQDAPVAEQKRQRLRDACALDADGLRRQIDRRARHVKLHDPLRNAKRLEIVSHLFNGHVLRLWEKFQTYYSKRKGDLQDAHGFCIMRRKEGIPMTRTNVMRLLDAAKIQYHTAEYAFDENDLSGLHAAEGIGMPPEQIFKTLVAHGDRCGYAVFCIPVCCELDLKKAAKAAGDKKIELIHVKDLLATTGYIRGGCSPIGMKKPFPTYLDETAQLYDEIGVSAGSAAAKFCLRRRIL